MSEKNETYEVQRDVGVDSPRDSEAADTDDGIKTGTNDDAADMHRLGKKQEFKARTTFSNDIQDVAD